MLLRDPRLTREPRGGFVPRAATSLELGDPNMRGIFASRAASIRIAALSVVLLALALVPSAAALGADLAQGATYTVTVVADPTYPDTGGTELTNGVYATNNYADSQWQGRWNAPSYSITIDLASIKTFQNFSADFYKYVGGGVQPPTAVAFSYSEDNTTYTSGCSINTQMGSGQDLVSLNYACASALPVSGRYVKVAVTSASSVWSFIDEVQVNQWTPVPAAHLAGTFLQPAIGTGITSGIESTWTDAQWNTEYDNMTNAGLNKMLIQWVADSKLKTTIYPSGLSGYTQNTSRDVVAKALTLGNTHNVDVYLGLQFNPDWFVNYANNATWLNNEATTANSVVDDLVSKYGTNTSLKGFYITFEVDNANLPTSVEWDRLVSFYNTITNHIHTVAPGMKVMISPFYNKNFGKNPTDWQTMWQYILSRTSIDIIALQDGVGAGHATTSDLATWFAAMKNAITNAHPATLLWSDTETFQFTPFLASMPTQLIAADMNAVASYVSDYVSFSFTHYISPQSPQVVSPLYYTTYQNYVMTGSVESSAPTTPTSLSATAVDSQTINLSWTTSTDNFGVVGYNIYRNNALVWTSYSTSGSFQDIQLSGSTLYSYKVQAFDAAGNLSAQSSSASATTPAAPVYSHILSANKTYTATLAASPTYPDTLGKELTDGSYGTTNYADSQWQARLTDATYSFTVDLGSNKTIQEINADFLQYPAGTVTLPRTLNFYVSTNGSSFTLVKTITNVAVDNTTQTKKYKAIALNVSGRYVKVEAVPPSNSWTFIDEIQVRN
jgi:hypothetical protein